MSVLAYAVTPLAVDFTSPDPCLPLLPIATLMLSIGGDGGGGGPGSRPKTVEQTNKAISKVLEIIRIADPPNGVRHLHITPSPPSECQEILAEIPKKQVYLI
jgi:hypothetical protein